MKKGRKISSFFYFLVEKFVFFTVYIVDSMNSAFCICVKSGVLNPAKEKKLQRKAVFNVEI